MKKIIQNQESLLLSHAIMGDATAFFTLVDPIMRHRYATLRKSGILNEQVTETLYQKANLLFLQIQKNKPENFDFWIKKEIEFEEATEDFSPAEFSNKEISAFSNKLHHYLQKGAYQTQKKTPKLVPLLLNRRPLLIIFIITGILVSLFIVLFISKSAINIQILTKSNDYSISFPIKKVSLKDIELQDSLAKAIRIIDSLKVIKIVQNSEPVIISTKEIKQTVKKVYQKPVAQDTSTTYYNSSAGFSTPEPAVKKQPPTYQSSETGYETRQHNLSRSPATDNVPSTPSTGSATPADSGY
jgi:hypothetical protein